MDVRGYPTITQITENREYDGSGPCLEQQSDDLRKGCSQEKNKKTAMKYILRGWMDIGRPSNRGVSKQTWKKKRNFFSTFCSHQATRTCLEPKNSKCIFSSTKLTKLYPHRECVLKRNRSSRTTHGLDYTLEKVKAQFPAFA